MCLSEIRFGEVTRLTSIFGNIECSSSVIPASCTNELTRTMVMSVERSCRFVCRSINQILVSIPG